MAFAPVIERDGPLATILDSVAQGERVILISGVPGVGKTTLLEAAVERIGAPTVLTARATADRAALVLALRWVILHLADRGRLVITVDDAQWADEASAALISGALALVPDARIVSLGTVREGNVTAGSHLDVVMASSLVVRVPALTRDGVAALIGERTLDADDVHRLTGGVPFYVKAMLAAHDAGEDTVTPSEVARSVAARLARRGEDARRVAVATAPPRLPGQRCDARRPRLSASRPCSASSRHASAAGRRPRWRAGASRRPPARRRLAGVGDPLPPRGPRAGRR